jgi:hypothetical protein
VSTEYERGGGHRPAAGSLAQAAPAPRAGMSHFTISRASGRHTQSSGWETVGRGNGGTGRLQSHSHGESQSHSQGRGVRVREKPLVKSFRGHNAAKVDKIGKSDCQGWACEA